MKQSPYPNIFEGSWIWGSDKSNKCILSYEFYLTQIPSSADFWFSVGEFAHVYVNGMHLTYGPHPSSHGNFSINYLDITFLLQSGKNNITVLVAAPDFSLYSRATMPKGFWAQILIDENEHFATGSDWKAAPATHILDAAPRRSAGCLSVQSFDLRSHHLQEFFSGKSQINEQAVVLKKAEAAQFNSFSQLLFESASTPFPKIRALGLYDQVIPSMHIDFSTIYDGPGAYVATSYFYVADEVHTEVLTFSDSAFKVFVNGYLINEQGSQSFINDADPRWHKEMSAMERGDLKPMCSVKLKKGWNSLRVLSYADDHSRLLALNFVSLSRDEAIPYIQRDDDSDQGHLLAGPLNIPFPNLAGSLNFNLLNFVPVAHNPYADISMFLQACSFKAEEFVEEGSKTITLAPNQYLCYDLQDIRSGCVRLSVDTPQDSDVFLVFAESFNDGIPRSLHPLHGRRAIHIKLKAGSNNWEDFFPVGLRYVFILSAANFDININDVQLLALQTPESSGTKFECPDMTLNSTWQRSLSTLSSCSEYSYMDSPSGRRAQFLRDAALQSIYSMTATGQYDQAKNSLIEFSRGQYETGELPSVYPSSYFYTLGESSMYWVIWLQQYLLHTNDLETAEILLSTLKEVVNYYSFFENEDELLTGSVAILSSMIPDDAPMAPNTIFTSFNCLYLRMLSASSWVYSFLDLEEDSQSARDKMLRISKKLRSLCWDAERNLFVDWSSGGQQCGSYSVESNFLAMNAGIIPTNSLNDFLNQATLAEAPYLKLDFLHPKSPFLFDMVVQAATNINLRSWAFDLTRYYWGAMIEDELSTWPEFYDPDVAFSKETTSLCHGIGCGAAQFLINEVAGIRPAAPGYEQIYFNPLLDKMDWARARIKTVHGHIKVEWMKNAEGGVDVTLESAFSVDMIPQLKQRVADNSSFHLSDNISIIGRN
ncbi:alpha-L-rhamnosidase C-terminal domain-containing protein [Lentisphaera profundi]|uniref:Alpha-L-rhamnosidase C-terminal domain-containing protein n=1 Tax=Lentisphaera profundi TaxID=1658616 RepID=A0ABY7VZL5_9BACT|nr:alpha-L-rhamnosidase C-terminal domain-containing protein [Lentisphaera profundi]WDE98729.1 alpha-L-rhamnosidase C-terminal domain-containing protein [Lentisphaera profundi]